MSMAQLLSNARFYLYADVRLLEELSADNNADGTVSTSDILTANLLRAGEEIASAATRGNIYNTSRLEALATANNAFLEGLVADLAICYLFERRGGDIPDSVRGKAARAATTLSDLRDGKSVFADDAARAAGLPAIAFVSPNSRSNLRLAADSPFFKSRNTQAS